jgi:hypothetical protein
MSLQALVRVEGQGLIYEWESNLFGHAYDLFESVKDQIGHPNLHDYASNEYGPEFEVSDDEMESLQQEMGESDEDPEEILLSQRGPFYDRRIVSDSVSAYKDYFLAQPPDKEFQAGKYRVHANVVAEDLSELEKVLLNPKSNNRRVRIYVG